jgi:hypothetical protein
MFGIFKKKQPTAIDGVICAIYGDRPPAKSADLEQAVTIAHEDLLGGVVPLAEVRSVAKGLFAEPMPYSTHDLAVAVALSFFKNPIHLNVLNDVQLAARLQVLDWMKDGKVASGVTRIFEDTLHATFKPGAPSIHQLNSPSLPSRTSSDEDAQFDEFQKRNAGRSLDEAFDIVMKFLFLQHGFAEDKKPLECDDEQLGHAERIELAFLFGAVRLIGEAFSFSPEDDDTFLADVMGWFQTAYREGAVVTVENAFEAIDVEKEAMWVGREAMISYLLNGQKDEGARHLGDFQKVCWNPVDIQGLAFKTQRKLQEEFAALGINFMQLHPLIHGSVLREATFAGVPLALQHFHEYSQHVAGLNATDDEKAETLLDIYREHERAVGEAIKRS